MIRFIQIEFIQAMNMIQGGKIENVYYLHNGSVSPVSDYKCDFDRLKHRTYFKREEIESNKD